MEARRGESSVAEICRKQLIAQIVFYKWNKEFMEAGKKRLAGDTAREAISEFILYYNSQCYHESQSNLTPAGVYFGRQEETLKERERIKKASLKNEENYFYIKNFYI